MKWFYLLSTFLEACSLLTWHQQEHSQHFHLCSTVYLWGFFFVTALMVFVEQLNVPLKMLNQVLAVFLENLVNLLMNVLEVLFFEMLITSLSIQIISRYPTYLKHSLWHVWCSTNTFFKLSLGAKSASMIRTWLNTFMKFWNHSVLSVTLNFNSRIC